MTHTVFICRTCSKKGERPVGAQFVKHLRAAMVGQPEFKDVVVRGSRCMLACGEPLALSLQCPTKVAYLFSHVHPEYDLENVLALVRLFVSDEEGVILDARPIGRLRHCLKGRLPATQNQRL